MVPTELVTALDNIDPKHTGSLCRFLQYAVEARAGYAFVEAIEQGMKPEKLGAKGEKATLGISIPTQRLKRLIYIPQPLLAVDRREKRKDHYQGITLFSADQVNAFHDGNGWYEKELVETVILHESSGAEIMAALESNWAYRFLAKQYCRELITRVRDLIGYESEHHADEACKDLPVLAFKLAQEYANEMG